MTFALSLWDLPSLPIANSESRFPVRRIFCVGRNYAEHVREMGGDPDREAPFFFMKPADSLVANGSVIPYPPATQDLHHEVELVVAMKSGGRNIPADQALNHIFGYGVGVDLTRRDLQGEMKQTRRPWEIGKAFENAAPCGTLHTIEETGPLAQGSIWLDVDGTRRQDGDLAQMVWSVADIVAHLSRLFTVKPGDIIYTGTPDGVGPLVPGNAVQAAIAGLSPLTFSLSAAE